MDQTTAIVSQDFYLQPAAQLETILRAYQLKKEFVERVLREGVDFGKIPGAGDKPALLKAGAEKFANLYNLAATFEAVETVEDWTGAHHDGEPLFYYRQRCSLWRTTPNGTRILAGSAEGSCNSWEKKYRYRNGERVCPQCGKPTIIKGKAEYGGGYVCFAKKGGCGAKFRDGDQAIEGQQVGQVKNPDIADIVNTVLKMAQKRALVAATLITTGASDYFTQDVDDYYVEGEYTTTTTQSGNGNSHPAQPPAPASSKPADPIQAAHDRRTSKGSRYGDLSDSQLEYLLEHSKSADDKAAASTILDYRMELAQAQQEQQDEAARAEMNHGADN